MATIEGFTTERFSGLAELLSNQIDSGEDVGASIAVHHKGEVVADIWGGLADPETGQPWERDTLTNVFSTTKTMTFLVALMLADRGELDMHAPVARYWPEFAQAGKEDVEVRHLLSHTAGLSGWTEPLVAEDLADWEKCCSLLAAQEPWWEPGTASGYHALTQGYLIGEVVRRITGTSFGAFFASEVAEPLGADFFVGLPESEEPRVSLVIPPATMSLGEGAADSISRRTWSNPPLNDIEARERWWRAAEIPAANGQGNARSVATIQSIITGRGESGGVRLLSEQGVERLFETQADGIDLVLDFHLRFGLGYGLSGGLVPIGERACFWAGLGGSLIVMDLDLELTACYVMNRMADSIVGDMRGFGVILAAAAAAMA